MRIRWRDFELPNRVVVDEKTRTDRYAAFTEMLKTIDDAEKRQVTLKVKAEEAAPEK